MSNTTLVIIAALLMLPGVAGVFLPILPSIPFMFIVALIFGAIDHFVHLSGRELSILGAIAIFSLVVDYLSGVIGAKLGGASREAIFYGLAGLIIGLVIFPPLGGIAGLLLGVIFAELRRTGNRQKALRAAAGSLIGTLTGMVINFILAVTFIVLFIWFAI
ncbi:MAG: DUF456 domain-containing protein [Patescibacteria group bacterium]